MDALEFEKHLDLQLNKVVKHVDKKINAHQGKDELIYINAHTAISIASVHSIKAEYAEFPKSSHSDKPTTGRFACVIHYATKTGLDVETPFIIANIPQADVHKSDFDIAEYLF